MAHPVKCPYCQQRFDRDKEPFIQVAAARYAHKACAEKQKVKGIVTTSEIEKSNENLDELQLRNYIDLLWNKSANYQLIAVQLKRFLGPQYKYTYKGIHNALLYYYDITNHYASQEYNNIGIVPYYYDKAQEYFDKIATAREQNKKVGEIEQKEVKEIHIPIPQTTVKKRKLFTFFEEDN